VLYSAIRFSQMALVVRLLRNLLLIGSLLAFCPLGRAQHLVYALSFSETRGSLQARFPSGALRAPINDRLAMLRHYRKTEIYSVSMIDGKRSLLFSDEGMNFEITPVGSVSGEGKAYLTGVEREWRTTPLPGAYADPSTVYEISLNGSRQFHRLFETQPNQSPAVLNAQSSKAAFESFVDGKYVVSIYDVLTWRLIRSWELTKILQAHCASCTLLSFGWMADGQRLFFNLAEGDDDGENSDSPSVPGTYIASEEGKDLGKLSPDHGRFRVPGYVHPNFDYLLGQLPDGSFAFQAHAMREGRPSEIQPFTVISNNDSSVQMQFPDTSRAGNCRVAPSGKYLAYIEERTTRDYRPEFHLWSEDLETGKQKEQFVTPRPNPPTSTEPNVMITLLGWIAE
jgi:hypothetical protein